MSVFPLLMLQTPTSSEPIVVKIYETPSDPTGLSAIFLGVARFAGVYVLAAVLLGAAIAAGLFWYRSR